MTRPLRSTGITPLHHYYGAVRPSPAHRYFRPRGWSRLRLSYGGIKQCFLCFLSAVLASIRLQVSMAPKNEVTSRSRPRFLQSRSNGGDDEDVSTRNHAAFRDSAG